MIVDDITSVNAVPGLNAALAEDPSFGGRVVLGMPLVFALREVYGTPDADAIADSCATRVVFRVGDAAAAMRAGRASVRLSGCLPLQGSGAALRTPLRKKRSPPTLGSRRTTLERLSAANEVFDLSGFEAHLPSRPPGYLIRTSKRPGMEGLRQHDCVAEYHTAIQRRYCAIATVFVNRMRWTVALPHYEHEGKPWIAQIAGQRNQPPRSPDRRHPEEHSYYR